MVENTPASGDKLPVIQSAAEQAMMTEYERRLQRAKRFGIDVAMVTGPQVDGDAEVTQMDLPARSQNTKQYLNQNIEKIKHRQQKFSDIGEHPDSGKRIEKLENRITRLHNVSKPEQIQESAKICEDTLYLYGTDYMSNSDIRDYFLRFPSVQIKWINDSSCTLQFHSFEEAAEAYRVFSIKPVKEDETLQLDKRNFDSRIGWREAINYHHSVKGWQTLWIRFATDLDVKSEETKGQDSRFYRFHKA